MNRRDLLKNLGLGAGFLVVGPTTFGLLQSCKNDPQYDWQPAFLTASNGHALKRILDIILPTTDTPGASDLNIAEFIDSYMNEVASEDRQEFFRQGADDFAAAFEHEVGKGVDEGTDEEFDRVIRKYLLATPAQRKKFVRRNTETQDPLDKDPKERMDFDAGTFSYLQNVRETGIWAWKNSEEIGENVLWYDPIPGVYIPCGPVDELSNGRAMSL